MDNLTRRLKHVFGGALVFILAGYAFFGRRFAYIHLPLGPIPLYIGEIVLAVGMLAGALALRSRLRQLWNAPCLFFLAFALWGACLTVPYLGIHGINAIRDAALVYYGLFMVLVLLLFQEPGWIKKAQVVYGHAARWFPLWVALALIVYENFRSSLPTTPGTDITLLIVKSGDLTVHLMGALAYLMISREVSDTWRGRIMNVVWYSFVFFLVVYCIKIKRNKN